MSPWNPPAPSERALEALDTIARPSVPGPLPNSTRVGVNAYLTELTREQVMAAYSSPDAPVPAGSKTEMRDDAFRIVAPLRESAVLFAPAASGCVYLLLTSPSLVVHGAGEVPSSRAFAVVGYDRATEDEPFTGLMAYYIHDQKPWLVSAGNFKDEDGKVSDKQEGFFVQASWNDALGTGFDPPRSPARITAGADRIHVEIELRSGPVALDARPTHSLLGMTFALGLGEPELVANQSPPIRFFPAASRG